MSAVAAVEPVALPAPTTPPPLLAAEARFLPIEMSRPTDASTAALAGQDHTAALSKATIEIELRCGSASLGVRWSVSAAGDCAAWLREVAAGLVK